MKRLFAAILLSTLILWGCAPKVMVVASYEYDYQRIDSTLAQIDSAVYRFIEPYGQQLSETMNKVIAYTAGTYTKNKPESTLGNLLADATKAMAEKHTGQKIDVAIINYGGIRVPALQKGAVTVGNIYEVMPFDNYLVTIDLTGADLLLVLQAIAANGGWPISGATFNISEKGEPLSIRVGKRPIHMNFIYTIALSDYIANGGDNMDMLSLLPQNNTGILLRDAFIEYFSELGKRNGIIEATIEGRIKVQ